MQLMRGGVVLVALALVACQGTPPPRQASLEESKASGVLAALALQHGDYAKAAELYRSALVAAPENPQLHYGLGVSASYLEQRAEAVREMIWVLERGDAGSAEVRAARRWLASVGALPRRAAGETTAAREETADQRQQPAMARVHGRVMLGETPTNMAPVQRMQVFLMEHPSRERYFRIRTDEQGYFRFENVPPGVYKLTERAAGHPTWRLRVELKPGQDLAPDLHPSNSTRVRDDFPDATLAVGPRSP